MLKSVLNYLRTYEPARLRAGYTALIALLATQGVSLSTGVDGKVQTVISVIVFLLPLVQGELTRRVVSPAAVPVETVNAPAPEDGPQVESQDPAVEVTGVEEDEVA